MDFSDKRKIKSTLRQLKSRFNSLQIALQKAPTRSTNTTFKHHKRAGCSWENIQISSPSRRHLFSLKEHFQDIFERFRIPSEQDRVPTLQQLASYSLGKVAVFVSDLELDDFYDIIPPHCRQ
jgi:hypothetical protein